MQKRILKSLSLALSTLVIGACTQAFSTTPAKAATNNVSVIDSKVPEGCSVIYMRIETPIWAGIRGPELVIWQDRVTNDLSWWENMIYEIGYTH